MTDPEKIYKNPEDEKAVNRFDNEGGATQPIPVEESPKRKKDSKKKKQPLTPATR